MLRRCTRLSEPLTRPTNRSRLVAFAHTSSVEPPSPFPYPKQRNPTPYQLFHLPRHASPSDIKHRYYELVRIYHPDTAIARYSIPPDVAHDRFQAITAAYDKLREKPSTNASTNDDRWPTAAAWRARQNRTRDLHSEGNGDKWKDRIIVGGVMLAAAAFIAQMASIRKNAVLESQKQQRRNQMQTRDQREAEEQKLGGSSVEEAQTSS